MRRARLRLERLRRAKRHAEAKEEEGIFALTYKERQRAAIESTVKTVADSCPNKCQAVWKAVNILTGRKDRAALTSVGETAEARRNNLREFFATVVNAPNPPPLDATLPAGTPLPAESDFRTDLVTPAEVVILARQAPGGKATGPDDVPIEALRLPRVATEIARIMNNVLQGSPAPEEWRTAHVVAVPKIPGTTRKEEHRGISIMSCAAKIFNKWLLSRLRPVLDPFLRREQNVFRPYRSTATQILALRRVIEEARIFQSSLICVFVDFQKAFDSVSRTAVSSVLRAYNVPMQLIKSIMSLYDQTKASVVTPDGLSDPFTSTSGVLQGDTLAPFLFVLLLDWVLRVAVPSD